MKYITLIEDDCEATIYCLDDEFYSEILELSNSLGGFQCIYDILCNGGKPHLHNKCREIFDKIRECDILETDTIVIMKRIR